MTGGVSGTGGVTGGVAGAGRAAERHLVGYRRGGGARPVRSREKQLVGDCAVACAFVSYCGAFNQEFRLMMINERFRTDCMRREIPVSDYVEVTEFLVDQGTIG